MDKLDQLTNKANADHPIIQSSSESEDDNENESNKSVATEVAGRSAASSKSLNDAPHSVTGQSNKQAIQIAGKSKNSMFKRKCLEELFF